MIAINNHLLYAVILLLGLVFVREHKTKLPTSVLLTFANGAKTEDYIVLKN